MKIAIIGGTGLLGSNLLKYYSENNFDVKSFSRSNSKNTDSYNNSIIDFDNLEYELKNIFSIWRPDVVINTVALVNLQKCEADYNIAYNINVSIAMKIASVAKKFESYFIHISTDHFFNDTKIKHSEYDGIMLLNNYAKTKFEAEKEVLAINTEALIVRTNIIGFRSNDLESFFEWLLNSIKRKDKIELFTNFFTSPISVKELSDILIICHERMINGVYNIASTEVIDKYTFGIKTAKKFGYNMENIYSAILKNNINDLDRALTLGLDVSKIENILKIKMPTIEETLNCLYNEYKENNE